MTKHAPSFTRKEIGNGRFARVTANLLVVAGMAVLGLSPWWARGVATAIESLPGGKWLSVPLPFLPLLLVLAGVSLRR